MSSRTVAGFPAFLRFKTI
jgi:predicted translin family RNA/ssDNA-binding protein